MEYTAGDFSFVKDHAFREEFERTYKAVTDLNMWGSIGSVKSLRGDPLVSRLFSLCEERGAGHSGSSWLYFFSHMQKISKLGWNDYVSTFTCRISV